MISLCLHCLAGLFILLINKIGLIVVELEEKPSLMCNGCHTKRTVTSSAKVIFERKVLNHRIQNC